MLKQVFDREQLSKAISSTDVWQWDLLSKFADVKTAIDHTVQYWNSHKMALSALKKGTANSKSVFIPANMEDAFAIKLADRFIRKIYKVRQSDRNRIIRQLITILKDSGKYHLIRLDIKSCYETIQLQSLINKFSDELILAPECIKLLTNIHNDLIKNHDMHGLPRGLSISPTLAELYLESLDKKVASHPDVIYSSRYVDDIIVLTTAEKGISVQDELIAFMHEMGLTINDNINKCYSGPSHLAEFDYLGYFIKVEPKKNKPNDVTVRISGSKLNKIKSRIAISFCDYKKDNNINLLKRRIEYLGMLKTVRKSKNGNLLAGIANNYQYVTDQFECLKPLDGFLCKQLINPRFGLGLIEQETIKKVSIYGNTKKRNIGNFSKKQTCQIMRVWKNA
jgi:hypothetical protein